MRTFRRPDAIPCIPLLHVEFLQHAFASLPAIYFSSLSLLLLLNPGQLLLPEHLGHAAFLADGDVGLQHFSELQATPVGEGGGEVVPHCKTFAD